MTTVITKLFEKEVPAQSILKRMRREGFPPLAVRVVPASDAKFSDKLSEMGVARETVAAYADKAGGAGAVLVVRATYRPLGAAKIARKMLAAARTVDIGDLPEEVRVKYEPERAPSILPNHPRFLTMAPDRDGHRPGPVSRAIGIKLLSPHRTTRSVMSGGGHMSTGFWPMSLVWDKRRKPSAMKGGGHMSKGFWPMPLVTTRERRKSVIAGGDLPFSRLMGWRTLSDR